MTEELKQKSSSSSMSKQQPSTKSTTKTFKGSHEYVIKGYSLLNGMGKGSYVSSNKFEVGGYDWRIMFYPNGCKPDDNPNHICVFIELTSDVVDGVDAFTESTLIDQSGKGNHKVLTSPHARTFKTSPTQKWGYYPFIKRTTLENSKFLKDDCLAIRCTLRVVRNVIEEPKRFTTVHIPPSEMSQSLTNLLESGISSDITFEVGQETFKAHKWILLARLPVFTTQFFGLMGNEDVDKILIKEVEPSVFKAMLIYLYSDELPLTTLTKVVQNLLAVADKFGLDRLKLLCEARLCEQVTTDIVATTLALAEKHQCSHLKTSCLQFVTTSGNLEEVIKSEGFGYLKESCPSLLLELLQTTGMVVEESILSLNRKNKLMKPKKNFTLLQRVKCWLTQGSKVANYK